VNNRNKFEGLRGVFLFCFLFGGLFYFFNHLSESRKQVKAEKQSEYVLSYHSPAIAENHEIKISTPLPYPFSFYELSKTNSRDRKPQRLTVSEKTFLQVKILLKQSSYNLFFASGFHEPPPAA
jgi:hypothetical protein